MESENEWEYSIQKGYLLIFYKHLQMNSTQKYRRYVCMVVEQESQRESGSYYYSAIGGTESRIFHGKTAEN